MQCRLAQQAECRLRVRACRSALHVLMRLFNTRQRMPARHGARASGACHRRWPCIWPSMRVYILTHAHVLHLACCKLPAVPRLIEHPCRRSRSRPCCSDPPGDLPLRHAPGAGGCAAAGVEARDAGAAAHPAGRPPAPRDDPVERPPLCAPRVAKPRRRQPHGRCGAGHQGRCPPARALLERCSLCDGRGPHPRHAGVLPTHCGVSTCATVTLLTCSSMMRSSVSRCRMMLTGRCQEQTLLSYRLCRA